MNVALIVAMAQNGVIGINNQLPWYLPEDLKYFKTTTLGKPIIMGRKTYESIGKPLPGRTNIVISRQADTLDLPPEVKVVATADEAIDLAESISLIDGVDEVMVIGGEQIYQLFMSKADRVYLTRVHADVDGDAYFSSWDERNWQQVSEERHAASGSNPHDYSFCVLEPKN